MHYLKFKLEQLLNNYEYHYVYEPVPLQAVTQGMYNATFMGKVRQSCSTLRDTKHLEFLK